MFSSSSKYDHSYPVALASWLFSMGYRISDIIIEYRKWFGIKSNRIHAIEYIWGNITGRYYEGNTTNTINGNL